MEYYEFTHDGLDYVIRYTGKFWQVWDGRECRAIVVQDETGDYVHVENPDTDMADTYYHDEPLNAETAFNFAKTIL